MRTIFQAVKTGIFNGIAGAVTLTIVWQVNRFFMYKSYEREVSEVEENFPEFFSNFRDFITNLGRL